jgi:diguanylate cyclase (GGDEF)-like protein
VTAAGNPSRSAAIENEPAGREAAPDGAAWSDWQRAHLRAIGQAFPGALPARQALIGAIGATIREAIAGGKPAAIVFVDINNFSEINAAWGLQAGDDVLSAIEVRLAELVGETFAASAPSVPVVGRLDADHFIAVLPEIESPEGLRGDIVRLVRTLPNPIAVSGHVIALSVRAAIVPVPTHGRTASAVLARGFRLLNGEARRQPDGVAVSEDRGAAGAEALQLERDLAAALGTDQLFLFLQPKVEIATSRVHGAEALVRWRHPGRGLIPTPAFIEMAERSGLIFDLGLRILRDACRVARLPGIGGSQTIGVNVSAEQLSHPDFLSRFLEIVDREGVPPQRLEIEITETAAMTGGDRIMRALEALRRCGIGIAIDDFGTGYSNLSALAALPADGLKIDRSLVIGMEKGDASRALLDIAVQLGRTLGLTTVAEGVETEAQLAYVARLGCDLVQGHLTGAAVPVAEYVERYGARQA